MNYEEKYKEALERARVILQDKYKPEVAAVLKEVLQSFFPELAESENERIRNMLIENFSRMAMHSEWGAINAVQVSDILAWLKKQGEKSQGKSITKVWKDMRLEVFAQASGNRHEPNYSYNNTKMFSLNDIDEIIEKISEQNLANSAKTCKENKENLERRGRKIV